MLDALLIHGITLFIFIAHNEIYYIESRIGGYFTWQQSSELFSLLYIKVANDDICSVIVIT